MEHRWPASGKCGWRRGRLIAALVLLGALAMPAMAVDDVPVPMPRPERSRAATPDVVPVPRPPRPGEGAGEADEEPAGRDAVDRLDPADIPVPAPRPAGADAPATPHDQPPPPADMTPPPVDLTPPPRPQAMPADEAACRQRLSALGVRFEERAQLADASGCSAPWPLSVDRLADGVALAPDAVLNCATAERLALFVRDEVAPRAEAVLGSALKALRQDSAYVCRPRNGSKRLSEHAFANAVDIGAFVLADGRSVAVGSAGSPDAAAFMLAVRLAACGPFRTVLGPGSDADHATHFHFDLAQRRSGGTFCQ